MRIIDPQSAVLTNVEVLSYLTANPPRRSPNPPPNADRLWVPSPDLRDHNTVVKEIHNYVLRISPHLLKYPRHTSRPSSRSAAAARTGSMRPAAESSNIDNNDLSKATTVPPPVFVEQTPMDRAMRELITRLKRYNLTKAEVVMILNLGVGITSSSSAQATNGDEMEVDEVNGEGEEGEAEEDEDFGALALFESVVEEMDGRMNEDEVKEILAIIREVLNEHYGE
ncbi:hypothetical protein N7456_008786 [Penicillium angulare]|uniref:DNA-directed RNA polymerase III subunit RPC9 n=1 Tax=Penicillium angulare TaxID=116970 RepID=A0A9W9K4V8_9EURO|nr:hypothetical protein N7456_008786 [Penicillium angulare]